jgi:hypothetical protein
MKRKSFGIAVVIALSFMSNSARAQEKAPRPNLISTNPIGMLFEWYNAEIEHAFAETGSIGLAATYVGFDDEDNYTTVDAIVRYYPNARAIRGFAFGGSVGFARISDYFYSCADCPSSYKDSDALAIGIRGDYTWILGRDQRFSVAAGIGAKRLFYSGSSHSDTEGLPIGRLSIGYAW